MVAHLGPHADLLPVDAALYDKFVYYGAYTQLANQCPCANPSVPGKLIRFIDNRLTDTQVSIWKVEEDKEFIVAIPGTTSTQDAITDISVLLLGYHSVNVFCPGLCAVHSGFLTAWNSVAGDVTKALTELLAKNPEYTVSLTGHSLGGAIVGLAFPSLRNGPYNVTQAFTFGQPQVGNQAYANYLDSISGATEEDAGVYYRVTHANGKFRSLSPRSSSRLFGQNANLWTLSRYRANFARKDSAPLLLQAL